MFGKALLGNWEHQPMFVDGVFNRTEYDEVLPCFVFGGLNFYSYLIGGSHFLIASEGGYTVSLMIGDKSYMKGQEPVTSIHIEVVLKNYYRASSVVTEAVLDDACFGSLYFTDVLKGLFEKVSSLEIKNILEV